MASKPGVLYYCPCAGSMSISDAAQESDEAKQVSMQEEDEKLPVAANSPALPLRASPIEDLYYCDDCNEIRCSRCVVEEPAGYHCPNCLFDVPTASVRSENNCCARNCFQCPVCTHTLSVVENEDGSRDGKPFSLACSVCYWDSRAIGWAFEKATGISGQIEKMRANEDSVKEYNNLLDHWRTVQRASTGVSSSSSSSILGSAAFGSLKHRLSSAAGLSGAASAGATVPAYQSVSYANTDHSQVSDLMSISDADTVSFNGGTDRMEPKRIRLHMKLARRCRKCHHILIKPESKAQATRFKIQLVAAHFLPTITLPTGLSLKALPQQLPLRAGATAPVLVRFSNPLYTEMKIALSCHVRESEANVSVLATQFTLAPFTELWEYDDDDGDDGDDDIDTHASAGGTRSQVPADGDQRGVVHRHGNRVAIQFNITPKSPAANLTIPFHITCTHVDDMDGDGDVETPERPSNRTITHSFWVYVCIGQVQ
ncbi:hypothetical protein GGI12_002762 [Dipsacomyces acuminosporus]|nr:hypothetical protein GGI12_002762 [Dipsacomyces acuminosporus]